MKKIKNKIRWALYDLMTQEISLETFKSRDIAREVKKLTGDASLQIIKIKVTEVK